jgi:hypothetical protein
MERKDYHQLYEKLCYLWKSETQTEVIGKLTPKDLDMLMSFQKEIHESEGDIQANADDTIRTIISELKTNSCKMVDYLINDLLDVRQEKIIKHSRDLDPIDESFLTTSEREFYKNIMSAFKGYNKMRNVYGMNAEVCEHPTTENPSNLFCKTEEYQTAKTNLEYILIRSVCEIPSLVGQDSLNYGPFKKDEIAYIPKINGMILEKEKMIEFL